MWNAILRWSIAQPSDGTRASEFKPMSDEDKKFLDDVMKSMVVDEIGEMKKIVATLNLPLNAEDIKRMYDDAELKQIEVESKESITAAQLLLMVVAKKVTAIEDLEDYIGTIDRAQDLHKIQGLEPLLRHLECDYDNLAWRAASVLGSLVQNNPQTQETVTKLGAIPKLITVLNKHKLSNTTDEHNCVSKALYALSGLLRHYDPALNAYIINKGPYQLLDVLINPKTTVVNERKVVNVLHYLATHQHTKDDMAELLVTGKGYMTKLISFIGSEDVILREGVVKLLIAIFSTKIGYDHRRLAHSRCSIRLGEINGVPSEDVEMHEDEKALIEELLQLPQPTENTVTSTALTTTETAMPDKLLQIDISHNNDSTAS